MPDLDDRAKDKLSKIVMLAKHGIDGEKFAAYEMVLAFCRKYNLDPEEVMLGDEEQITKYEIKYKTARERKIITGVISKTLNIVEGLYYNKYYKVVYVETTASHYFDLLYVIDLYLTAYRKAMKQALKDIPKAFAIKHELWAADAEGSGKELTYAQWKDLERQAAIAKGMARVEVRKGIESGS